MAKPAPSAGQPVWRDLSGLSPQEFLRLVQAYETLVQGCMNANNVLIHKLTVEPGVSEEHVAILNDWSSANNALHEVHALAVEKLCSTVN